MPLQRTHVMDVFAGVCCHVSLEAAVPVAQVHCCAHVPVHGSIARKLRQLLRAGVLQAAGRA
jgi:hypothetical protein